MEMKMRFWSKGTQPKQKHGVRHFTRFHTDSIGAFVPGVKISFKMMKNRKKNIFAEN